MDGALITALAQVLNDSGNQEITASTAKARITAILAGRSPTEVLRELDTYLSSLPSREKGKVALIVIAALLRLDLDSRAALAQEIQVQKYALAGPLYGGLITLLSGKSQTFTLRISVLNRETKNAYEEIDRWNNQFFWPHIALFLAARLLYDLEPCRFEQLAQWDPNNILLLSMVQGYLSIAPSDTLLKKLLESSDPFHPNFALAFYVQPLSPLCDKVLRKTAKRSDVKKLNEYTARCLAALAPCSPSLRAELLTNYLLVHHWAFPEAFARQLVGRELQNEFARQIIEPGRIRTIQVLGSIADLIMSTPACNGQKHRISKKPLADAVLCVLMRFVSEHTGIYVGDNHWLEDAKAILRLLTVRQKKRLGHFLNRQDSALMISPLDELVRFDIYLKDSSQHQIIQGLRGCLSPTASSPL